MYSLSCKLSLAIPLLQQNLISLYELNTIDLQDWPSSPPHTMGVKWVETMRIVCKFRKSRPQFRNNRTSVMGSYLDRIRVWRPPFLLRQYSSTSVSLGVFRNFHNSYYEEYLWTATFKMGLYIGHLNISKIHFRLPY